MTEFVGQWPKLCPGLAEAARLNARHANDFQGSLTDNNRTRQLVLPTSAAQHVREWRSEGFMAGKPPSLYVESDMVPK